jgi:hypothetical protein
MKSIGKRFVKPLRTRRTTEAPVIHVKVDPVTAANLEFISEMGETLLGLNLSGPVMVRRALELLADLWEKLILKEVLDAKGKVTAELLEKLKSFLRIERAALYAAAGRTLRPRKEC